MASISSTLTGVQELDGLRINPYADWEKQTRLTALTVKSSKIGPWNPVFVKLKDNGEQNPYRHAASEVLRRVLQPTKYGSNILALDALSLIFLLRAGRAKKSDEIPDQFASFFLWRPSDCAYHDLTDIFDVVFVGPESATLEAEEFKDFDDVSLVDQIFDTDLSGVEGDETVVTAVIDDQIGFAHERFRSGPADSRFEAVFVHQNESFQPEADRGGALVQIGGLLVRDKLNELLADNDEIDIYRQTDRSVEENNGFDSLFGPFLDKLLTGFKALREFRASHGTFVGDLAAGYPMNLAKEDRPVLGFDLSRLATGDTSGTRLDVFGLMGIMFVTGVAPLFVGTKNPIVTNLSYALQSGPKDGTGFFEKEAIRLIEARNRNEAPTWLVLPSGNSFRSLTRANLSPGRYDLEHVDWHVQPGDETPSYVETWLEADDTAALVILPPIGGEVRVPLSLENSVREIDIDGVKVARIYFQETSGRLRVTLAVAPTSIPDEPHRVAPPGRWRLSIQTGENPVSCDLTIQRDDTPTGYRSAGRQSYFDAPNVGSYDIETGAFVRPYPEDGPVGRHRTLSAYASAKAENTFVVGGAIMDSPLSSVALYSSSGPDALGRPGIDLAAVTEESRAHPGRLAAGMMSSSSAVFSGTSTAAPIITRRIVDALSIDPSISKAELVDKILESPSAPDLRLGAGVVAFEQADHVMKRRV